MSYPPLPRAPHKAPASLTFLPSLNLTLGRVHEFCGIARWRMALWVAAATDSQVFWIAPGWSGHRLHMEAVSEVLNPGRLTFISAKRPEDILWSMEEILSSGALPLCIAEVTEAPGLTPIRRLHLAAETGGTTTARAPLGVLLTPGGGGAPGVESRWQITSDMPGWQLARTRARMAPEARWSVGPDRIPRPLKTRNLEVV